MTTRRAVATAGALVAATVVVLGGTFVLANWPASRLALWTDPVVSEDGRTVTVTVTGGECDDPDADVDESGSRVLITVRNEDDWFASSRTDIGVIKQVKVHLDGPLGDRELLDGALGRNRS